MPIRGRYSPFNLTAFNQRLDHGLLLGLDDDDHLLYIKDSEFTQDSGVLVGTGAGTFQEETGDTLRTSLGLAIGTDVEAWDAGLDSLAGLSERLGGEELADSGFDDAGEWTGTDWTIVASIAAKPTNTGIDTLSEDANPFTVKSGTRYKVVLDISTIDSLSPVQVDLGGDSSGQFIATGIKTFYLDTINTNSLAIIGDTGPGAGGIGLSSISVKEVINTYIKATAIDTYTLRIPSEVRTDLGLVIGTDVQAHGDVLDDLNTLGAAASDGQFIVATGAGVFAYEKDNVARTSLGLGTGDSPTFTGLTTTGSVLHTLPDATEAFKIDGVTNPWTQASVQFHMLFDSKLSGSYASAGVYNSLFFRSENVSTYTGAGINFDYFGTKIFATQNGNITFSPTAGTKTIEVFGFDAEARAGSSATITNSATSGFGARTLQYDLVGGQFRVNNNADWANSGTNTEIFLNIIGGKFTTDAIGGAPTVTAGNVVINYYGGYFDGTRIPTNTSGGGTLTETSYGGYFTASGADTNYGIYSAAGLNYLSDKLIFTQVDGNEFIDSLTDGELDVAATTSINFLIGGTEQVQVFDGKVAPTTNNDIDLGDETHRYKEIFSDKVKITSIGGYAVRLTNETGVNTVAGQVVRADTATNDAVILTAADEFESFGVFLDSGIADGSEAWVVTHGIADVAMEDNTTATRGNWVRTSVTEAGYADATNAAPPGAGIGEIDRHLHEIGHCIETVTATGGGTHILARCVLHFN